MFTYLFRVCKHLKSGLLLDFFFKKTIFLNIKFLFFYSNIIFSEKYFIEYNFLLFKRFITKLINLIDIFQNEFIFSIISTVVFFFLLFICFI